MSSPQLCHDCIRAILQVLDGNDCSQIEKSKIKHRNIIICECVSFSLRLVFFASEANGCPVKGVSLKRTKKTGGNRSKILTQSRKFFHHF